MRSLLAGVLVAASLTGGGPARGQSLPGTQPWDRPADPAASMVADLHTFLDRETEAGVTRRPRHWNRDLTSDAAYIASVAPNRARLQRILGATGPRISPVVLDAIVAGAAPKARLAEGAGLSAYVVRWTVYPGFEAEGLLIEPTGPARSNVVLLGDADALPEDLAGLTAALPQAQRIARRLAESGCRVLVPTLLSRADTFSGNPAVRMTNLSHREWVYRMAFEAGRHVLGYEIDEVRAAVDWLDATHPGVPIGVAGHGEGGLVALDAAALDPRIFATWVAGSFGPLEATWSEPIDRNVWGLLDEFGGAEIASLVYPRALIIEACRGPEVAGTNPPRNGRNDAASGRLTTPSRAAVDREAARISVLIPSSSKAFPTVLGTDTSPWNADEAGLAAFLLALNGDKPGPSDPAPLSSNRPLPDPSARMKRLVDGMVAYTQGLVRTSEGRRDAYWKQADPRSPDSWSATTKPYRDAFHEDLIGRFPPPSEPVSARTKQLADRPNWTAHAVEIPVWPGVTASGVLLLPKDLKPGERRPVVVCQHGLEGTPDPIVDPAIKSVYNSYGAQLADRGYIVYAPQNPYTGHDTFRTLQRKAQPLKKTLFSIIAAQHQQTLNWLKTQPNVDPARIAFYGLSYGGKTAMRVPAMLEDYCLSICSADFNDWATKTTTIDRPYSYMFTLEYDMYEFGLTERFNYAEMAALIAPRPFMVERGHQDMVAPDEWIGYEYAKVKRLYDTLGLSDRTEIGYFNAGHQIEGKATFAFLARHLNWPRGMP
jgi:dienelactone hydrolase